MTNFRVRGRPVEFGQAFNDEPDWLRHISFDVTNISERTITRLEVDGYVRTSPVPIQLRLAEFGSYTVRSGVAPTNWLRPQETAHFEYTRDIVSSHPEIPEETKDGLADPRRILVRVQQVVFDDDTMWDFGQFFVRDMSAPDRWLGDGGGSASPSVGYTPKATAFAIRTPRGTASPVFCGLLNSETPTAREHGTNCTYTLYTLAGNLRMGSALEDTVLQCTGGENCQFETHFSIIACNIGCGCGCG
ncbi:MAG TPA: hypothetical protein VI756_32370 [Blastocatellia bacterium]